MKIAFFSDSYKPYLSGVTNSTENLVDELRELGHRVYIFAPHYPNHLDTDPDIIRFPSIATHYPKFRIAIPYINRVPEVDLIHAQTPFQVGILARYLAKKRSIPLAYSFHTLFTKYVHYARFIPEPLSKMSIVAYLRSFCSRADVVITPSELSRRVLRSWKVTQRIEVIPSGVRLNLFDRKEMRARLRETYDISEECKVLLYVGRISKEKNLEFLLKAFDRIKKKHNKTKLVLVGGGPLANKILKRKDENIVVTGEIPYPEVLGHYAMGDIFVFSSLTETQGLVIAEAKSVGLPVVALFAGALVGTIRSGYDGYLVSRNQDSFVEHVVRLLEEDGLRFEMGKAAYEDAIERFASYKVAKQVEGVYNSLIKN
ncbi:MAG: glycosyltransferase [Candidatus Saganbacteria bacterium]|nr:glycosyltransferase [Candidatus Saganbacteria bacterium]